MYVYCVLDNFSTKLRELLHIYVTLSDVIFYNALNPLWYLTTSFVQPPLQILTKLWENSFTFHFLSLLQIQKHKSHSFHRSSLLENRSRVWVFYFRLGMFSSEVSQKPFLFVKYIYVAIMESYWFSFQNNATKFKTDFELI